MRIRTRENVVLVPDVIVVESELPRGGHWLARFRDRRYHIDEVGVTLNVAMQISEAAGDHDAIGIEPRPVADTITCIDGRFGGGAVGAEISTPSAIARADGSGQTLAFGVSTGEPAEIAVMCGAGDKEAQRWLRLLVLGQNSGRTQRDCRSCGKNDVSMGHDASPPALGFILTDKPV